MKTFFRKLRYIHWHDIVDAFKIVLSCPCGWVVRRFRPNLWLISERGNEAHDNGYWLFRYVCEHHPEQDVVYPITYNSPDYDKVARLGKTVKYGTFRHHILFWAARKNISAHVGNGFPAPFMCRLFLMSGFYSFQNIFIQHGVTQAIPPFLMADRNRIDLFLCAAEAEREAVVRDLGYASERVVCTGLCRYDALTKEHTDPRKILIMLTWRWWLNPLYNELPEQANERIRVSRYVQTINTLLHDRRLVSFLEREDLQAVFMTHPQMQPFLSDFSTESGRIRLTGNGSDIQDLLRQSAFLITDYSSIFFDFAYMGKPMVLFQFDSEEYHEKHYPTGYFDYERDGFGPVTETVEQTVEALEASYRREFVNEEVYAKRAETFFAYRDTENCRRTYEAIKNFTLPHKRRAAKRGKDE